MKIEVKVLLVGLLLISNLFVLCYENSGRAVIVYGASCSGKSTLAKALKKKLAGWEILEFDAIEMELKQLSNQVTNSQIAEKLFKSALAQLENGTNLIIDTNVFDETWISALNSFLHGCIFVFCPREELLLRNSIRDQRINRSPQRSFYAKKYVESTYERFSNLELYDLKIDSSTMSVDQSLELCLKHFYLK